MAARERTDQVYTPLFSEHPLLNHPSCHVSIAPAKDSCTRRLEMVNNRRLQYNVGDGRSAGHDTMNKRKMDSGCG